MIQRNERKIVRHSPDQNIARKALFWGAAWKMSMLFIINVVQKYTIRKGRNYTDTYRASVIKSMSSPRNATEISACLLLASDMSVTTPGHATMHDQNTIDIRPRCTELLLMQQLKLSKGMSNYTALSCLDCNIVILTDENFTFLQNIFPPKLCHLLPCTWALLPVIGCVTT